MIDGVYIGLPHSEHIAQTDRLGSTDLTRLYTRRRGWWWSSINNPHYVPKKTEPMIFGDAWHCLSLEGRQAFQERFAVMPNPRDYPNLLTTADDLYSALKAKGVEGLRKKMSKNDLVQMGKAYLDGAHIWDDIVERWERTARDKKAISSADAFAIEAMYGAALQDDTFRSICEAFGGVRLTEITVLWTLPDGIKLRYRFDSLLPSCNVDLKSLGDWRSKPLMQLALDRISNDHLDVQLAMSHLARQAAYELIAAGEIFSIIPQSGERFRAVGDYVTKETEWLRRFPGEAPLHGADGPGWGWAWLFYQKPEDGAEPGLLPIQVPWGNNYHVSGWRKIQIALTCYREAVKEFGLAKPWTRVHPVHTADQRVSAFRADMPMWHDMAEQQPGEMEAMEWRK